MTTDYEAFLAGKRQFSGGDGFKPLWLSDQLFPFQRHLTEWALLKGRGALLEDCGLGKTVQFLVWAENVVRHTNRPVLVLTPLTVAPQTVAEGEKFGVECRHSRNGKFPSGARVVVTNYEQLHHFNPHDFAGGVGDESSILKNFDGKRKAEATEFLRTLQYRLLCTATAAPNDYIELGTHSEALGELGHMDMLARFFKSNNGSLHPMHPGHTRGIKGDRWRFRGHAERDFWRWVCSWARACRKPSDLGFDDGPFILPGLETQEHVVESRTIQPGRLFNTLATNLDEQREERRRTIPERCEKVAELLSHTGKPAIAWCHLNDEGDLLERLIPGAVQVAGADSDEAKEEKLLAFIRGEARVLVSKPKVAGFGLNLQHCAHMSFFPSHCYDERTELLTSAGWKSFGDVAMSDRVGTINPETHHFEWETPTDVIWDDYHGEMISFQSRSFNLLVTPNHRMWVRRCPIRCPAGMGEWRTITADELASTYRRQEYRMMTTAKGWDGAGGSSLREDAVYIPRSELVDYTKARTRRVGLLPSDIFARLAGWYLSEGCATTHRGELTGMIVICQTDHHPENRREIIETLEATGLAVRSKTKDINIANKELAAFLVQEFGRGSGNMRIPRWMKDWPSHLLRILWDAIMAGDGMHLNGKLRGLKSTSSRLLDDVQEIGVKLGISTTNRSEADYLNIRSVYDEPSIHHAPERVAYSGKIGCVTVPNGLVVVRRNGDPIVSGNSFEQWYQCIRRCHRFGQLNPVKVEVVATEGEMGVLANLQRKTAAAEVMFLQLVALMNDSLKIERPAQARQRVEVPAWI